MSEWLRSRNEISEYPYNGTITRVVEGSGMEEDTEMVVYEGMMDDHTVFCDTFTLTVDNAEPSQLGGVSVYATRNSW